MVCGQDGAEIVEFAFASSILFTLFFAIIEFSIAMYVGNFVAYAAQKGARYAMVHGATWGSSCTSASQYACETSPGYVQSYVTSLEGLNLTASNVSFTAMTTTATGGTCTSYTQGCQVKVTVSYSFPLHIPFLNTSIPFSSTSIETIQN